MKLLRSAATAALATLMATSMLTLPAQADDSESRDLEEFSRIVIKGAMDIEVEVGKNQSVEVFADRDYLSNVETYVRGDTLYLSQEGRRWHSVDVDIEIQVRNLDSIRLEGAADIDVINIDSDNFELEIDGAGDVTLEGTCGSLTIEINGAGDIDAEDLKCKSVDATINGAGDIDAYASESVVAVLNGVGDITICGNPERVRPRIHGFGSFEVNDCD